MRTLFRNLLANRIKHMNSVLVSLHNLTKKVQFYSIFAGIVHIYLEWTSSLHLGTFFDKWCAQKFLSDDQFCHFFKNFSEHLSKKSFQMQNKTCFIVDELSFVFRRIYQMLKGIHIPRGQIFKNFNALLWGVRHGHLANPLLKPHGHSRIPPLWPRGLWITP